MYQRYAAIDNYRRLIAAILPRGLFCAHTVGYLADIERHKLGYLTALLNSRILDWRFSLTSTNNNINGYEVETLPIPTICFNTAENDRLRYLNEAKLLYDEYVAQNDGTNLLGFVEQHLSRTQQDSDVVHDLLAFLAEEMIRLKREKRAEQKRYLDGLVAALRVQLDGDGNSGLDALTGKSKLAAYPGDYQKGEPHLPFEELVDTLRKNRTRLGVSLTDSALVERLRREYEASLARVLPLKEQLARTDRLIDQIVYKLYGLTEDEIAIVEGR